MGFLRNIAGLFIPTSWELYAIIFLAGLCMGGIGVHKLYEADAASQIAETLKTDRASFGIVNRAGSDFVKQQKAKEQQYVKENADLKARIARAPKCTVPVPNSFLRPTSELPNPTGLTSGTRPTSAPLEADCGRVVISCEDNRQTVCEPAADQADALRKLYKDMQKQVQPKKWWQW